MKKTSTVVSASLVSVFLAAAATAATRTWNKSAGGTYGWNAANFGGTLPTADDNANFGGLDPTTYRPTGNQTITGDGEAKTLDFHNTAYSTARTFTGDITASNLVLRVGRLNVEGTLSLTGTGGSYSIVGAAFSGSENPNGILDVKSGGTFRADGVHAICVGRRYDGGNKEAGGRVILRDGGTLSLNPSGTTAAWSGLLLGRSTDDGSRTAVYPSSYIQEGGTATVGRLIAGFEKGAYAAVTVEGGTLVLPHISNDTRFRIGHAGYGIFQLLGGDVRAETNYTAALTTEASRYATRPFSFEIGIGKSVANGLNGAYFYGSKGSFATGSDFSISGQTGADAGTCAPVHATLDGSVCVTARTVRVGANLANAKASLNLNGGTLVTDFLFANPGRPGKSEINANGGSIVFPASALQTQGLFLDAVNVYEGGLAIHCGRRIDLGNAGTNVLLRTPGGYGVAIDSVTDVGASTCPPWIEISGGSGSNAAAIALASHDTAAFSSGVMTNAVVVCPGEGYAAGDTVTATVYRPWGATQRLTDRVTLKLVENKPGALVKTGGYNLNLFAQPEFAGTYEVRQGYMIQSTAAGIASPRVAAVVAGGGTGENIATFQAGSGNATAVEDNWNPVNPAATLTLGTADGPGILNVPAVARGDSEPFAQTFASLSVSGTGNAIEWANGSGMDQTVGTAVKFGTISCAEGSQLTIPDPKSTFKVYCTGMPAGTALKNIVFDGDSVHTAMVGDDGQLVPMPLAFVMVVR